MPKNISSHYSLEHAMVIVDDSYCFLYTDAIIHSGASFGQGSGPIYLDDVTCSGTEARLIDCSYDRSTSDCSHSRDAGVTCGTECMNTHYVQCSIELGLHVYF